MKIGPVSIFDCVKSNRTSVCEYLDFETFVAIMNAYSHDEFASKNDAPLICMTEFQGDRRSKANATQSGMVVLDIDDHLTIEEVTEVLHQEGIAALLCSTASHRDEHHKFRIFIPLLDIADYDDHVLAWHVLNHAVADGKADPSKIGCESMFFVPGIYPNAPQVFELFDGYAWTASSWINQVGSKDDVMILAGKSISSLQRSRASVSRTRQTSSVPTDDADLDLNRTRLVSDKMLDAYRSPAGSYHHARFALLMSMAGRAIRLNLAPTASDLQFLFNQIDLEDGGYYQSAKYQAALLTEASKALSST
jgi:hypothetical protein